MLLHSSLIACANLQSSHGTQVQVCGGCAVPQLGALSVLLVEIVLCSTYFLIFFIYF